MSGAISVERGCGRRKQGGCYAEVGMGPDGMPVEHFLIDPPIRIDEKVLGLSSVGVKLIKVGDVYHVFDIVGEEYYPNVADMVEEIRRFGMSRRCELASAEEYAKITPESRYVLLHKRAWFGEFAAYYHNWVDLNNGYNPCVKNPPIHFLETTQNGLLHPAEPCAGLWWQDVDFGEQYYTDTDETNKRVVCRAMPSFTYIAAESPKGLDSKRYELAIFAKLPITRFVVVKGGDAEKKMQKLGKMNLDKEYVDE